MGRVAGTRLKIRVGTPPVFETAEELIESFEDYLNSISRQVVMTEIEVIESVDGEKTVIEKVVENSKGEPMVYTEWLSTPGYVDFCNHIGIHRSTLTQNYAEKEGFIDTFKYIKQFFENQLIKRGEKVQGTQVSFIMFQLKTNYGYDDKTNQQEYRPINIITSEIKIEEDLKTVEEAIKEDE